MNFRLSRAVKLQFYFEIIVFVEKFYVNFLSSRKYDWNVAPKDLEKIRRAHGACVVFFLKKKIKVFYSTTTIKNKRIKSIFQLAFYFISCYYYYNTIKQSTLVFYFNCLLFTITFTRKVSRKIFQKYTKSFGGKIWANMHSVSPDNDFSAKNNKIFL